MSLSAEILNYINALKWPAVVSGGVYYFRKPLWKLADRLSSAEKGSFSGMGVAISWEGNLEIAAAGVEQTRMELWAAEEPVTPGLSPGKPARQAPAPEPKAPPADLWQFKTTRYGPLWQPAVDVAKDNPVDAVQMAWLVLEGVLRARLQRFGLDTSSDLSEVYTLRSMGLPTKLVTSVLTLESLRVGLAKGLVVPTTQQAMRYIETAQSVADTVNSLPGPD